MAQENDGIFTLGDLLPKTRPVRVIRNGETVTLAAYFDGDGCPVPILMQMSAAKDRYRAVIYTDGVYQENDAAFDLYCMEMITTAVPDLTADEVEIVAGSKAKRIALLQYLDWFEKPRDVGAAPDDTVPEAAGGAESTMADSSPASSGSTASLGASS